MNEINQDHSLDVILSIHLSSIIAGTPSFCDPFLGNEMSEHCGDYLTVQFALYMDKPSYIQSQRKYSGSVVTSMCLNLEGMFEFLNESG